ncbi:MAG: GNAT family N-acetyltransferase [Chloroflexi bacterium]|nr:GNAT family N-acetyltransferase [Chloroflexota bacterium]
MDFQWIQTPSGLDALAQEWNPLLSESVTNCPFLRHEYLRAWWETRGGGEWRGGDLAIVTARRDGGLVGAAPMFLHGGRLLLLGCIEISDVLDLLVRPAELPEFTGGLLDFLVRPGPVAWSALDWYNLPEASPTLAALETAARQRGWSYAREKLQPSPYIPLPGDFETYLSGLDKKQRHEVRRKMRRATEYVKPVRWYIVDDEASLASEINAFMDLMAHDPAKAAFLTDAMRSQFHSSLLAAFRNGWLQLAFMEVDGEKAAAYLNFDYDNRIWVYNSGLDRRFMELSPGWALLGNLLEWANQNRRREFDFMRGGEDYKYRFGGVDRFVVRAIVGKGDMAVAKSLDKR